MANDPHHNVLGQERYDIIASEQTKARGLPGPDGDAPTPTGAVCVLSGRFYSLSIPAGATQELTRHTFAAGELDPATDVIAMQIWPTSDAVDSAGAWDVVGVLWNSTGLFSLPATDISGYCWYANMTQFTNNNNADILLIDPGPTAGMGPRPFGPQYNSIAIAANWMGKGGSLIFQATNAASPVAHVRAIIKIWKITPTGSSA
jgi:hypothetical protein